MKIKFEVSSFDKDSNLNIKDFYMLEGGFNSLEILNSSNIIKEKRDVGFYHLSNYHRNRFLEFSGLETDIPLEGRRDYFLNKEYKIFVENTVNYLFFFKSFIFENGLDRLEGFLMLNHTPYFLLKFEDPYTNTFPSNKVLSKGAIVGGLIFDSLGKENIKILNTYGRKDLYYGGKEILKYFNREEGLKLHCIKTFRFYYKTLCEFFIISKFKNYLSNGVLFLQVFDFNFWSKSYILLRGICNGSIHTNYRLQGFSRGLYKYVKDTLPSELKVRGVIRGEVDTKFIYKDILLGGYETLNIVNEDSELDFELYSELEDWSPTIPIATEQVPWDYEKLVEVEDDDVSLEEAPIKVKKLGEKKIPKRLERLYKVIRNIEDRTIELES